jgi:hypothetical protein
VPAHLTLFRQLPPTLETELGQRLAALAAYSPPRARIGGVIDLGGGTALRVESEELEAMRAELADAFRGLLIPQDMTSWRPRITIQNKVPSDEARRLQRELGAHLTRRPLAIRALATWRYLDGPWEAIRTFPFRR